MCRGTYFYLQNFFINVLYTEVFSATCSSQRSSEFRLFEANNSTIATKMPLHSHHSSDDVVVIDFGKLEIYIKIQ
jgi:hypothetical protein